MKISAPLLYTSYTLSLLSLSLPIPSLATSSHAPAHKQPASGSSQQKLLPPALINEQNTEGQTALHLAAAEGLSRWTQLLLEAGAKPQGLNHDGFNALHLAARNGHSGLVKLILAKVPDLVDAKTSRGQTALHLAIMHQQLDSVKVLLASGAKVTIPDKNGLPPLLLAVMQADPELLKLVEASRPGSMNSLKVPLADGSNWLHVLAAQPDQTQALKILLAQGLDPLLPMPGSDSIPAVIALKAGALANASVLLEAAGLLTTAQEADAWNALKPLISQTYLSDLAAQEALKRLVPRFSQRLLELHSDGLNLLQQRILEHDQASVRFLLSLEQARVAGWVEQRTAKGQTPLMLAITLQPADPELVRILLEDGAKVKEADRDGNTALHLAVLNKQPQTVALLLPYFGALPVNHQGQTPLDMAQQLRHGALIELLRPLYIKTLY